MLKVLLKQSLPSMQMIRSFPVFHQRYQMTGGRQCSFPDFWRRFEIIIGGAINITLHPPHNPLATSIKAGGVIINIYIGGAITKPLHPPYDPPATNMKGGGGCKGAKVIVIRTLYFAHKNHLCTLMTPS